MWPPKVLLEIGTIILNDSSKLQKNFDEYVKKILWPAWTSKVAAITGLIDFRDYAEDTWASTLAEFGLPFSTTPVGIDKLVKLLKTTVDPIKRRSMTVAFVEENVLTLRPKITTARVPSEFVAFSIDRELEIFYAHAKSINRFRPLLKANVTDVEGVLKDMDAKGSASCLEDFQAYGKNLGLTTLWPVLALWDSNATGSAEDVFLHPPLARVFGAPSCMRNAVERRGDPAKLVKPAREHLNLKSAVLAGNGHLAFQVDGVFVVHKAPRAGLVAPLPGLTHVWVLDPQSLEAAIYSLRPFKCLAEFEVPRDETEKAPNWIDCQRDSEGSLVLLWGHINPLTGSLHTQNVAALDEEAIVSGDLKLEFLQDIAPMPERRTAGVRIDWRDHGNLLSVHHAVTDHNGPPERHWSHVYEIVFGSHLLMTLTTEGRPIDAVFGSPDDVVLLSPLSSGEPLQLWTLSATPQGPKYTMTQALKAPKLDTGHWSSVCIV